MAVVWSNPKAPPPWDGSVRCALADCSTGTEANTAPITDGLDMRGVASVGAHIETAAKATGTIRLKGLKAGDTLTINGTVFTAVSEEVAPSAVQFQTGAASSGKPDNGEDYITAQSLAAAINASVAVNGTLRADCASDEPLVTISALADGAAGNALTLATSSVRAVLSGATLAGGAAAGVLTAGALQFYRLNPITGRWNRAPDLDAAVPAGGASHAVPPIPMGDPTSRLQALPNGLGVACKVFLNGFSGRQP